MAKKKRQAKIKINATHLMAARMIWEVSKEIEGSEEARFSAVLSFFYTLGSLDKDFVPDIESCKILDGYIAEARQALKELEENAVQSDN